MRKVIFIQSRMDSKRLPGKSMAVIGGETILDRIITTCTAAESDGVYVVTTDNPSDAVIKQAAMEKGIGTLSYPIENDVLGRFHFAATALNLGDNNMIVRVCGDSPLLKTETINTLTEAVEPGDDVVTYTIDGEPATVVGLGSVAEAVRVGAIRDLVNSDPTEEEREHVTLGMYRRDCFNVRRVPIDRPAEKESVDTEEDLNRIRRRFDGDITRGENNDSVPKATEDDRSAKPKRRRKSTGIRRRGGRSKS